MDKKHKKLLMRSIAWYTIKFFSYISGILPLNWSYFMGKVLGGIAYLLVTRHRRVAMNSLLTAFPQSSLKERRRITRNYFIFMAQGTFELLYSLRNPDHLKNIRLEGRKFLDKAFKKGKGVIILTAHLGNFPLMNLKLAKAGFRINIVARPMRDERAGDYLHNLRIKAGIKTIFSYPRKECIGGIVKALRFNEAVIIQMDQNFGTGGVWVKFFGKLAATPVGPIALALRTGAAVVPLYITREARGKHCIKIFPEESLIRTKDKNETILLNAIKFTRIIESWVEKSAGQWSWIHRRWKSRPSEEVRKQKFRVEG
ncbi:MAG: lysophospholipid acyltransferase family protein [Candidatus Omnitrophota bacterium]